VATADALVAALQTYTEAGTVVLPNAVALECVNLACRKMQRKHDFRTMQQSVQVVIPGGTVNRAPLPFDFIHEVMIYTLDPGQTDPSQSLVPALRVLKPQWFMARSPMNSVDPVFPNVASPGTRSDVTMERGYYVWAGYLTIVPSPSQPITLNVDYAKRFPDLDVGLTPADENALTIEFPDVVRAGALAEAYDWLHEEGRATRWQQVFEMRLVDAITADNAICFSGPSPKRGA
jgi:hypothetical protein